MAQDAIFNTDADLSSTIRIDAVATRARIVSAAERLFAERGIDATTLAQVNKAANQRNRSAVQYHFGNKEGVIHAILDKHTPGIESRRHAMLDEIEMAGEPTCATLPRRSSCRSLKSWTIPMAAEPSSESMRS